MHLETTFCVARSLEFVLSTLDLDETLVALLPGRSEVVDTFRHRKTTSTEYAALDRDRPVIFHFEFLADGRVEYRKECDGVVWEEFGGDVRAEVDGPSTRVWISMKGHTKPGIPEFAIKGPMEDQLFHMAEALEALL